VRTISRAIGDAVAVAGEEQFGAGGPPSRAQSITGAASAHGSKPVGSIDLPIRRQNQTPTQDGGPRSAGQNGMLSKVQRTMYSQVNIADVDVSWGPGTGEYGRESSDRPSNDRVEGGFPAAAVKAGTARFKSQPSRVRWTDAAEVVAAGWTPATTEAFATLREIERRESYKNMKAPAMVVNRGNRDSKVLINCSN